MKQIDYQVIYYNKVIARFPVRDNNNSCDITAAYRGAKYIARTRVNGAYVTLVFRPRR